MWTSRLAALLMLSWNAVASPVVQTTHGPIEGMTLTLFTGKKVDAFLGVPYAAPPTGQNRFAPTQPMAPWNETRQAKNFRETCPQAATEKMREMDWWVTNLPENEDCLYLNVWRPNPRPENKLPIIFWILGGGFVAGSSKMPIYNPSVLASEHDLMIVTLNYRLGMFGFLYLNNSDVPGNAGLQDQIQAVRWLKHNAEAFGGDPDRITLLGHSASSMALEAHLTNRDFSKSFRNAITHSGSIGSVPVTLSMSDALNTSLLLSAKVHCPTEDFQQMLLCLRQRSVKELQNTYEGLITNYHLTHCPVRNGIEVPVDTTNNALRVPPNERKNVLSGDVPLEFAFIAHHLFPGKSVYDNFTITREDFSNLIRDGFKLRDERLQSVFMHAYKNFDGTSDPRNMRIEALHALTDLVFTCAQIRFAKQWVTKTTNVFYYFFTRRPSQPLKFVVPEWLGTLHGDELLFITGGVLDPARRYSDEDKKMSRILMKLWSNFAKTGNPNNFEPQVIQWPSLKPDGNFTYLEIKEGLKIKYFLEERHCDFYYNVYPKLLSIQRQLKN